MADNTNNNFRDQVTTSGIPLFDDKGTWLKLGYLDDSLSLMICEPTIADNGKRTYPQESRKPFIITIERAEALHNEIIPKVLSSLEAGEDYDGGIFLNKRKDAIFEIRVQQGDIYAVYYKDIGEDRRAKETIVFKFQRTSIIENYNPDGTSFEQNNVEGQFAVFCKYIEAGAFDLHNSSVHSFRKGNYYTTGKIFDYLKGIAAKLGVTVDSGKTYTPNNNNRSNSGFMNVPDNAGDELPFSEGMVPEESSLENILS